MRTQQKEVKAKKQPKPPFKKQDVTPPGLESKLNPRPKFANPEYKGSEKLKGKVALITGGDSGIGRSVAVLFAREGADVAITHLPEEKSDALRTKELIEKEGQRAHIIEVDFGEVDAYEDVIEEVVLKFKGLDILVNNAAFQNHLDSIDDLDFNQFEHTFEVNVFAQFKMIKAALPKLKKGSCIINTGSILGYEGDEHLIDYAATKGAIHTLTKSLAKHLAKKGIRVNSVAPGPVWTPLNPAERKHKDVKDFGGETLFERPAQPEEIAPAFVYLASPITASFVTGETINLFGSTSGAN